MSTLLRLEEATSVKAARWNSCIQIVWKREGFKAGGKNKAKNQTADTQERMVCDIAMHAKIIGGGGAGAVRRWGRQEDAFKNTNGIAVEEVNRKSAVKGHFLET